MAKRGKAIRQVENKTLISVIGDEDTVTGFLLTGIGERGHNRETNFFIVAETTPKQEVEAAFHKFITRPDAAILLITQKIAEKYLREEVNAHTAVIPTILEIPSKGYAYNAQQDNIMQRAARLLYGSDKASTVFE